MGLPPPGSPARLEAGHAWPCHSRTVVVQGAKLRIATHGDGPPLLLLNGIGGSLDMWEPVASALSGRRLVMMDMPGSGGSPALRRPRHMSGYASLVVGLLDALGLDEVDVLGYSWGGVLAQQLARQAPGRVRSLILVATTPGLGGRPPSPWVIALMSTPARYYSRTYLRFIAPVVFGSEPDSVAGSAHESARLRRPPTLLGYTQQLLAISGWSSRRWLGTLPHRTLVLAGRRDPLAPLRNAVILARGIPSAELQVLPGGHLFLLEDPDRACALALAFLGSSVGTAADRRDADDRRDT